MNGRQVDPLFLELELKELRVSPEYQRKLNVARAKRLAKEWDWKAYSPIQVAHRPDGSLWVIDGQHTREALLINGVTRAPCLIRNSSGSSDEASGFVMRNTGRRALNAMDRLRARLAAGDPQVVEMFAAVEALGLRVENNDDACSVRFGDAIMQWWEKDPAVAIDALRITRKIVTPTEAMTASIYCGVALLLHKGVDLSGAMDRLCMVGGTTAWAQRINAKRAEMPPHVGRGAGARGILRSWVISALAIIDAANYRVRTEQNRLRYPSTN
jgi:hypothetical protein